MPMVESFVGCGIAVLDEDSNRLDKGADLTMEDKENNIMNRGTGMTWMLNFLSKKLWKRKKHKGRISPPSPRMMRTISIHHLECTDFVSQSEVGESASDSKSSKNAFSSDSLATSESESLVLKTAHESAIGKPGKACRGIYEAADDLSRSHEELAKIKNHLLDKHVVLKGRLAEARDALLQLKDINPKGMANEFANQSKLFLDALELLNANREVILDAPEDPNYMSRDYVERLQSPAKARMLTKSVSFPGFEFSGSAVGIFLPSYKRMKSDSLVMEGEKSESISSLVNIVGVSSDSEVLLRSGELRKRREAGTVLNRLRELKKKIKDVIKENRNEKNRISRDGILHKVPFGHKLLEDKKLNLWDDFASKRCDVRGEGRNINNAPHSSYSKFSQKSVQRSSSLTESLDRYCHLFETLSLNEKGEVPENSKSIHKDNGLMEGKLLKSLGRMVSSPVFKSYSFGNAVQSELTLESSKTLVAEPFGSKMDRIVSSKLIAEDNNLQQEGLPKSFGRTLSSPVFRSYSFTKAVQSERYLEPSQTLTPESIEIAMEKVEEKPNTDEIISPTLEKNDFEHEMVINPDSLFSAEENIRSHEFVTPTVTSITEMIENQVNPVSVDDCEYIEPSLFTEVMEEEANIVNRHEAQTKAESDIKPKKPTFTSSLDMNMVEGSASSANHLLREAAELQPMPVYSDLQNQLSDKQIKTDCNEQNVAEHPTTSYDDEQMASSFLLHVDHKYDTLFEFVRYTLSKSGYEPLLSPCEMEAEMITPFEQNLLLDLINEALQQIHENSTAPNPWLLHFHSKCRSMPVGSYLLKDVWTEISWHLYTPQGLDATLDDLMAHDFAKNDGWMNLYRDVECVALQLECLILDDLLDEAVVDSDGFDF